MPRYPYWALHSGDPDDAPDPADRDAYVCALCDARILAAEVVETPWGWMHAACAASEPDDDGAA